MAEHKPVPVGAPGFGLIDFDRLPHGTREEVIPLTAADGGVSHGFLYTLGGETSVVCFTHPRADMSRHYAMPLLLEAGFATFGQQCRGFNNDTSCIHEGLLIDIAAAVTYLKEERGFKNVIFFGNSGGGSLYSFYQAQAGTAPPNRLTDTPAGDPCDLNAVTMPTGDAIVNLAIHPGQGVFLMNKIDPSVTDESDPLSCDPSLDMYDPANGFREPPQESRYSSDFLARYRAAQRARIARLDALARGYIAEQQRCREVMQEPAFATLPLARRNFIARRAHGGGRHMVIYRTEADPAYCDLSLNAERSTRIVGTLVGPRPDLSNYMEGGFARIQTPRAWLSTWSGLSSRADTVANAAKVGVPALVIAFTADNACYPDTHQAVYESLASDDKEIAYFDGTHFAQPLAARREAVTYVAAWLKQRF